MAKTPWCRHWLLTAITVAFCFLTAAQPRAPRPPYRGKMLGIQAKVLCRSPVCSSPRSKMCCGYLRLDWDSGLCMQEWHQGVEAHSELWLLPTWAVSPWIWPNSNQNQKWRDGARVRAKHLLVLATCPHENVWSVSVRLWKVISFPAKRAYKL